MRRHVGTTYDTIHRYSAQYCICDSLRATLIKHQDTLYTVESSCREQVFWEKYSICPSLLYITNAQWRAKFLLLAQCQVSFCEIILTYSGHDTLTEGLSPRFSELDQRLFGYLNFLFPVIGY